MDIMRNGKQAKIGRMSPKKGTKYMGLMEKPISLESKEYGNLG